MKLVIERETWLRGEGSDNSSLCRDKDGKLCCLGFFGVSLGAERGELRGYGSPASTNDRLRNLFPTWLMASPGMNSADACELMDVNDERGIADDERESRLTELFAKHGVEVEFR